MKLNNDDITTALNELEGWRLEDNGLVKNFVFADFKEALSTMMGIGIVAEEMNHHPEWFNVYNKLDIRLTTHDAGGVTQKDIDLAQRINFLVKE
jgi:4a-hydroxytetrahydrobiopterin dehydratase